LVDIESGSAENQVITARPDISLLAFIRKRSFLDIGRERLAGLVQLEMDAVEYGSELLLG